MHYNQYKITTSLTECTIFGLSSGGFSPPGINTNTSSVVVEKVSMFEVGCRGAGICTSLSFLIASDVSFKKRSSGELSFITSIVF